MTKRVRAFERFEQVVDIDSFRSFRQLAYAFSHWASRRWVYSYKQNVALRREAEKRGFRDTRIPKYLRNPQVSAERTWRRKTVTVRGKSQVRYRDLKTGRFVRKP